jgi:hypothetical protein
MNFFASAEKIDIPPQGMNFSASAEKIDIPPQGMNFSASAEKIEMFFHIIRICQRSSNQLHTTTTNMLSFLKTGDINNTIRTLTNLPGLFTSDGSRIKYALLNHSTAMRTNISIGAPIFQGIRQLEAELERRDIACIMSGNLPSMGGGVSASASASASTRHPSLFIDNELHIDNAALALIMAKELAFLNRTSHMITVIANKFNEEQQDQLERNNGDSDNDSDNGDSDGDSDGDSESDLEQGSCSCCVADDEVQSLWRSNSHPTNEHCGDSNRGGVSQLVATFLIASGRMHQRITNLCDLVGTDLVLVNAMTTMDRPHNEANREKQLIAERSVISDIFLHFEKFDAQNRDPVVMAFQELRDISLSARRILSMYAFSNLFRLLEGTEFAVYYQPDDAIFTQGRDYLPQMPRQEAAVQREEIAVLQIPQLTE